MNLLILSLGTNNERDKNIAECRILLCEMFGSIFFSKTSITQAFGKQYQNDFLNQLALAYTDQDLEDILFNIKLIECQMGRKKGDKERGLINIDIDIVKWNDLIIKEEDWSRSYVCDLLPSLYDESSF